MREARIAVAAGLALIVLALGAVLAHSPASVARSNGIPTQDPLGAGRGSATVCQAGETLPRGTTAIVVSLSAYHGPRLSAEVLAGGHVLTRGARGSNWSGRTVTIALKPLSHTVGQVTVCVAFAVNHELVVPFGLPTQPALAATANAVALPGRLRTEYLRPGNRSWWSLARSTAVHLGLGRAASGTWVAFLALALALAVATTASVALLRELR